MDSSRAGARSGTGGPGRGFPVVDAFVTFGCYPPGLSPRRRPVMLCLRRGTARWFAGTETGRLRCLEPTAGYGEGTGGRMRRLRRTILRAGLGPAHPVAQVG